MSSSPEKITARIPQRERGKRRVAALLQAAGSLFAEKGYDAVTMTEIAALAGAPIGSLYQFFPSKEAVADALLERFDESLHKALNEIEERATVMTIPELAEGLLGLLVGLQDQRAAMSALIESRQEVSERAAEMRMALRQHLARILRIRTPEISSRQVEVMTLVVLQLIKAAARLSAEKDLAARDEIINELKYLFQLYYQEKISQASGEKPIDR